jgi:hypothetical protein
MAGSGENAQELVDTAKWLAPYTKPRRFVRQKLVDQADVQEVCFRCLAMEMSRTVQTPPMLIDIGRFEHNEQVYHRIVVEGRQQMSTLDQKRRSLALRPLYTGNDGRLKSLRLSDNIRDRLLCPKSETMKFKAIFLAMLTLDDFANKACTDSVIEAKAPAQFVSQSRLASSGGSADQDDWLDATHGLSRKLLLAAMRAGAA